MAAEIQSDKIEDRDSDDSFSRFRLRMFASAMWSVARRMSLNPLMMNLRNSTSVLILWLAVCGELISAGLNPIASSMTGAFFIFVIGITWWTVGEAQFQCDDCNNTLAFCLREAAGQACTCYATFRACLVEKCSSVGANQTMVATVDADCRKDPLCDCVTLAKKKFAVGHAFPSATNCSSRAVFASVRQESMLCTPFACVGSGAVSTRYGVSMECMDEKPTSIESFPLKLFNCDRDHKVMYDFITFFTDQNCAASLTKEGGIQYNKIDCQRKEYDPVCNDPLCTDCSGDRRSFEGEKCVAFGRSPGAGATLYRVVCPDLMATVTGAKGPSAQESSSSGSPVSSIGAVAKRWWVIVSIVASFLVAQ